MQTKVITSADAQTLIGRRAGSGTDSAYRMALAVAIENDVTMVDASVAERAETVRIVSALSSVGDWCFTAEEMVAGYDSDVSKDAVWSFLRDSAGLDDADLALRLESL